jgi:hypothetical protein
MCPDLRLQFKEVGLPTFNSPQANLCAATARLRRPTLRPSSSRNVHIHDDFLVMFHLFFMEVVSTVTNFVTSSQITIDGAGPLKIMMKLGRSS